MTSITIVIFDLNLLFFRYVVYDKADKVNEKMGFNLPWWSAAKFLKLRESDVVIA